VSYPPAKRSQAARQGEVQEPPWASLRGPEPSHWQPNPKNESTTTRGTKTTMNRETAMNRGMEPLLQISQRPELAGGGKN